MSSVFGDSVRGQFKLMKGNVGSSVIKLPEGWGVPSECMFVENVSVRKNEKKAIIQCFNSVNHIYAFGADPESSVYSCSVGIFLSDCGGDNGGFKSTGGVSKLIDAYKANRVSAKPAIVNVTVDSSVIGGILVGLAVDVLDAELNLFRATFMFNDLDQEAPS